ncbi:E3 ubiquitin-protein ligase CHFR-like [Selaginella moellendorffii]|uniref:E3 ubiquitin-protein ligase CHFR-like n=1 Tax=Selaginella moellendorffii TaxID=88036 RepID=UPI000D1C26B6|nr:E3 ubiquitin-protein ligase CHFR-like [Selaginella moellendorffii]|eukprot:XP_024540610.1 E3 ubiquitin-protein ligase CHFR-like [Selaginella moellendorffii]
MASAAQKRRIPDSLRLGGDSDDEVDDKRLKVEDEKKAPAEEKKKSPVEEKVKSPAEEKKKSPAEEEKQAPAEEEKKEPEDESRLKTTLDVATFKCCICLEIWHDVVCVSPCQHNFCNACFSEWYKTSQARGQGGCKCPQCRGDIVYACKNHMMASLVEDLLSNNPSLKRSPEVIEKMDKVAVVTSSFMKLNNPKPITMSNFRANLSSMRPVGSNLRTTLSSVPVVPSFPSQREGEDDEDEGESIHESEADSRDGDADRDYESEGGEDDEERTSCRQCNSNSSAFQCQPGSTHLICDNCGWEMPERTDLSVPQRCAACRVICCDAYWRSQNLPSDSGEIGCPSERLLPMNERQISSIPHGTHKSNTVEQEFTNQYISQHGLTVEGVVRDWMQKVDRSELALPDMQAITSTSAVCNDCADKVIGHLLDKFRMSIPKTEMPPEAARRDDCWYGLACRTQTHSTHHAKKLNHVCEPTSRNVVLR